MITEGFFIHRRHVQILLVGAGVEEVIDIDIIFVIVEVGTSRFRGNGFVLNINNSTSHTRYKGENSESHEVGKSGSRN